MDDRCATCHRIIYYSQRLGAWRHIAQSLNQRHTPTPERNEK